MKKAIHFMVWIVSVARLAGLALGVLGGIAQLVGWITPTNAIAAQSRRHAPNVSSYSLPQNTGCGTTTRYSITFERQVLLCKEQ